MLKELRRYIFANPPADTRLFPENYPYAGRPPLRWLPAGALLTAAMVLLWKLSGDFPPTGDPPTALIIRTTATLAAAGLVFLYIAELVIHSRRSARLMIWILFIGLIMRLGAFISEPILEVDYYRYLWDGAVGANGINPYAYAPADVLEGAQSDANHLPGNLRALAADPRANPERINHDYLRTIYPPVTQLAFALAYGIRPFDVTAWRLILLIADLATLALLFLLLKELSLSPLWISLYWLNPLLVKETINSLHMDILVFPFLLGAVFWASRQRLLPAITLLALAVGTKIWPVILAPIILRCFYPDYRKIAAGTVLLLIFCAVLMAPIALAGFDESSGFSAYGQRWQLNDAFFRLLYGAVSAALSPLDFRPGFLQLYAQQTARIAAGLLLFAWIVFLTFRKSAGLRTVIDHALLITAGAFLISPTQFPWYVIWIIPFLVLVPRRPLLLLIPLVSLYYLWYYFQDIDRSTVFDYAVVWLQFGPVWWLLIRDLRRYGLSLNALPRAISDDFRPADDRQLQNNRDTFQQDLHETELPYRGHHSGAQ